MNGQFLFDDDGLPQWQTVNRTVWDSMANHRNPLAKPASDEQLADPLPHIDGPGWLGKSIAGKPVLCLAAGGGRQGPLYAAAGADVTVVDLSPAMLELDRHIAQQKGLQLTTLEASMDNLQALQPHQFEIVIQPVSSCYVPDIATVYREVARVLRPGGIYISQHKQPVNLQSSLIPDRQGYRIETSYFQTQPLKVFRDKSPLRETGAIEYLHRWEQLIGGMCRAGFSIEDLLEPYLGDPQAAVGSAAHRNQIVPPYVRIKARRLIDT